MQIPIVRTHIVFTSQERTQLVLCCDINRETAFGRAKHMRMDQLCNIYYGRHNGTTAAALSNFDTNIIGYAKKTNRETSCHS